MKAYLSSRLVLVKRDHRVFHSTTKEALNVAELFSCSGGCGCFESGEGAHCFGTDEGGDSFL